MSKNTIIVLVAFLFLVIIVLVIYGLVLLPNNIAKSQKKAASEGEKAASSTDTNASTTINVSNTIKNLATDFRAAFTGPASSRCGIITKVNNLSAADLKKFEGYYKTLYKLSPKEEMDKVWIWCAYNRIDDELYEKLS